MNRKFKRAVIGLAIATTLPLAVYAEDANTSDNTATEDTELTEEEQIIEDNKEAGAKKGQDESIKLAERHAEEDFYGGLGADSNRSKLSDSQIVSRYYLSTQEEEYRSSFLESFNKFYTRTYNEKYTELSLQNENDNYESAKSDGESLGQAMGIASAMKDFSRAKSNDWQRAYSELVAEESVYSRYSLDKEYPRYADVFEKWFRASFNGYYTGMYRELNLEVGLGNIQYKELTGLGDIIEFSNIQGSVSDGSPSTSKIKMITLEVPAGAFYERSYIGMSRQKDSFLELESSSDYEPVTDIYQVTVSNQDNNIELKEDLRLTFEYTGTDRVGIYVNDNGTWKYLPTEQAEGQVSTVIESGVDYSGGEYALFIDNDFSYFKDVQLSWASDEIYSYLRRGYVQGYGDDTFKPKNNLTRLEFLILSSRIFDWDYEGGSTYTDFVDKNTFGKYADLISYASRKGYIMGYPDETFRAHDNISYREIEYLVPRLIGDKDFKWKYFAENMKHDKKEYSDSYKSIHKHINRAEVVYMYYELEKEDKI